MENPHASNPMSLGLLDAVAPHDHRSCPTTFNSRMTYVRPSMLNSTLSPARTPLVNARGFTEKVISMAGISPAIGS